jgi:alpha-galactosidase
MRSNPLLLGCAALLALLPVLHAQHGSETTLLGQRDHWAAENLLETDHVPISFVYDGIPSSQLLAGWTKSPTESHSLSDGRTQQIRRWKDPRTGLEVRIESVEYADYPAVEWTAYLKNAGDAPTPLLEHLEGIDSHWGRTPESAVLRTTRGDNFSAASYEPFAYPLTAEPRSFQPVGGRPTDSAWPYFNLDCGDHGVMIALGWPGQWQATFSRQATSVTICGGQETTHLRLQPGEEIRTPLVALLFWRGHDWIDGQNQWRHWFLAHNIPKPGGQLPPLDTMVCPELFTSAQGDLKFINNYLDHGFKPDYLWIDAGWYPTKHDWFSATGVGSWKPDPERYPHGIREVTDYVHSKGMKFVLWFEPERVYRGSDLWNQHPEWLLQWDKNDQSTADLRLLNLGNKEAREWISTYISHFITEQGLDVYRQDFNVEPLRAWQNNDTPDRQGMTENLYVQGYLAYWDTLLRDHPGLMIDSCASGGRRNDLETLRRGVPLLRSDYQAPNMPGVNEMTTDVFDGNQGHTYGLSLWVPYYGTGEFAGDLYSQRSHLCPWIGLGVRDTDPDWPALNRFLADHAAVAPSYYGDYYPITPYSTAETVWMAWEFYRPGDAAGEIQAFRRESAKIVTTHLKLQGLDGAAQYELTNIDSGQTTRASGSDLMSTGFAVSAYAPRSALIFTFKKVP